jgi:transcriptional regulator with XRE-family HTH domain
MAHDGRRLREARLRRGLTQEQFAQLTGWTIRSVARWESQGVPEGSRFHRQVERFLEADEAGGPPHAAFVAVGETPPAAPEEVTGALEDLSDATLLALQDDVASEVQRRFWLQRAVLQRADQAGQAAGPTSWPGTQLPHPDHLIEDETSRARTRYGD